MVRCACSRVEDRGLAAFVTDVCAPCTRSRGRVSRGTGRPFKALFFLHARHGVVLSLEQTENYHAVGSKKTSTHRFIHTGFCKELYKGCVCLDGARKVSMLDKRYQVHDKIANLIFFCKFCHANLDMVVGVPASLFCFVGLNLLHFTRVFRTFVQEQTRNACHSSGDNTL